MMKCNPLFSIIVPVYNAAKVIEDCILTVLAQSYRDFELLLVDDGSQDDSLNICHRYQKSDNRIKVFHQDNSGVSCTRNLGLKKSTGAWLTFIDSDDTVNQDWLKNFREHLGADIMIQGCKIIGKESNQFYKIYESYTEGDNRFKVLADSLNLINPVWSKCLRASIVKKNHLTFDSTCALSEDLIFVLEFLNHSNSLQTIDSCEYNYRVEFSHLTKIVHEPEYMIYMKAKVLDTLNKLCSPKNVFNKAITQNEIAYVTFYTYMNFDYFTKQKRYELYDFVQKYRKNSKFIKMHPFSKLFGFVILSNPIFDKILKWARYLYKLIKK